VGRGDLLRPVPPVRVRLGELTYDDVADRYTALYSTPRDQSESRLIAAKARAHAGNGLIIDVGCGDGIMLRWLGRCHYLGVDPSPRMIEVAQKRWPEHNFLLGTIEDVPDKSADFVLGAFAPLIHIEDVPAFAAQIERVLWPGRRFLVMGATRGVVTATGQPRLTQTPTYLQSAFREAGLTNVRVKGLFWLGRPLLRAWAASRCEWLVVEGEKASRT
jgi:SAM-dependent methyltransferase